MLSFAAIRPDLPALCSPSDCQWFELASGGQVVSDAHAMTSNLSP